MQTYTKEQLRGEAEHLKKRFPDEYAILMNFINDIVD